MDAEWLTYREEECGGPLGAIKEELPPAPRA